MWGCVEKMSLILPLGWELLHSPSCVRGLSSSRETRGFQCSSLPKQFPQGEVESMAMTAKLHACFSESRSVVPGRQIVVRDLFHCYDTFL